MTSLKPSVEPKHRSRLCVRAGLGLAVKMAVSAVTLWLVARSIALDAVVRHVADVDIRWVIVALACFWLSQFVSALRYVYISRTLGCPIPFGFSARLHFIGLWFNQVFPTSLGGDVIKVLFLQPRIGLGRAFRTTLLDRGSGLIFLLASIVVLLPLYFRILPNAGQAWLLGGLTAVTLAALGLLSWFAGRLVKLSLYAPPLAEFLQVFEDLYAFRKGRPLLEQTWTSAVVHVNGIFSYALVGSAMGLHLPFLDYILIIPLLFLVALVPISFAGWGTREVGAVWLFGAVGIAPDLSLAISVSYGLMLIIAGLPGLLLFSSSKAGDRI